MSIKPVDDLPESIQQKRKSYREMIRQDIQEAVDNRIDTFEFEGDYNFKYLPQYVQEEARRWFRLNIFAPSVRKVNNEIKEKYHAKYVAISDWEYTNKFLKVSRRKAEDRIHVYARIDFDYVDNFYEILLNDVDAKYVKQEAE